MCIPQDSVLVALLWSMHAVFEQEAGRFPSKNFSQFCRCGLVVYDLIYVSKIYVKYGYSLH